MPSQGFEEFDHTADWGISVWAGNLFDLLVTSARGMYHLLEVERSDGDRSEYFFSLKSSQDLESLLVDFLSELLYLSEKFHVAFDQYSFSEEGEEIRVAVSGFPFSGQKKEIKAVTYYNLIVKESEKGFETEIVFDV